MSKFFLAIAAGLLLALPAMADDGANCPCQTQQPCQNCPPCITYKQPPAVNGYALRCVRQSTFIENACCPLCIAPYVHLAPCCDRCNTCVDTGLSAGCDSCKGHRHGLLHHLW